MNSFMLEEYRQLCSEIKNYQESYTKLERLAVAGLVVVYGYLFSNPDMPVVAWWAIAAIVLVTGVRCLAYYWVINRSLAPHIIEIERKFYKRLKFKGSQTKFSERLLGRGANLFFNASVWFLLILGSAALAFYHEKLIGI